MYTARGILLEPAVYSDWTAPIVAILKSDRKTIRICGDFHMTDKYSIATWIEDLFATLQGGKKFTKLDLSQVFISSLVWTKTPRSTS